MGDVVGFLVCAGIPVGFVIYAIVKSLQNGGASKPVLDRLKNRIDDLEHQVSQQRVAQNRNTTAISALEKQLAELRGQAPLAAPISMPQPMPAPTPAPTPAPMPEPEPAPVMPATFGIAAPRIEEVVAPVRTSAPRVAAPRASVPSYIAAEEERELTGKIDWERWLGVRGAAVLGAIVLAIAGIMFFRYAIEHSLIPPQVRFALAVITGIGCLIGGERLRPSYTPTANALSAGGIVVLYAAFWASYGMYSILPLMAAFALMALTTAVCALLSVRYSSPLIAVLGIAGGFATPLILSSGKNNPIGLFGYVMLMDLGFLYVARRRGWALLSALLLGLTVLMQFLWVWKKMEAGQLPLALCVLGVFSLLFIWTAGRAKDEQREHWFPSQVGAVLMPFLFAQHFAAQANFGPHLYPVALLLVLLLAAAGYVSERQGSYTLSITASAATLAVVGRYAFAHTLDAALTWELAVCVTVLAAVPHVFVERKRDALAWEGPAGAALVAQLGLFAMYSLKLFDAPNTPLLAAASGWCLLAALLIRHGGMEGRSWLYPATSGLLAVVFAVFEAMQQEAGGAGFAWLRPPGAANTDSFVFIFLLNSLLAIGFQCLALTRTSEPRRKRAELAAVITPLVFILAAPSWFPLRSTAAIAVGLTCGWAYLAVLASTRMRSGAFYAGAMLVLAFTHTYWSEDFAKDADVARFGLVLQGLCTAFFMLWPTLNAARFKTERFAWYAAALAGPIWFFSLRDLWLVSFGKGAIGVLPVILAAASLGVFVRVSKLMDRDDPRRLDTLAWLAAVALGFVSVAIPLQLDRQWITLGWAIEGFAVIALWVRLDHAGLKYFSLALLTAVFLRLVVNDSVLAYEPRSSMRIVNWLMYTYWIPTAAMLSASRLLSRHEVERLRAWEQFNGNAHGAAATGFGAIVLFFVWINLAIADWFSTGDAVTLSFTHSPARDLTTSAAWALYAIVLLAVGMWKNLSALRWVSLCFLLLTIGKVFLYDLNHLHDLYRVVSLVGLAFSLIGVSLAYQRFVFRKLPSDGKPS